MNKTIQLLLLLGLSLSPISYSSAKAIKCSVIFQKKAGKAKTKRPPGPRRGARTQTTRPADYRKKLISDIEKLVQTSLKKLPPAGQKEILSLVRKFGPQSQYRSKGSDLKLRKLLLTATYLGKFEEVYNLSIASLRSQSKQTSTKQLGRTEQEALDAVFIGAGVHETISQMSININAKKRINTLTVEATNVVASNFTNAGPSFRLNSTNRTSDGKTPKPGKGNLNEIIGGWLQVPDVSSNKFPAAEILGKVLSINRALSNNPIAFNEKVVDVVVLASGVNKVILDSGRVIYAKNVLDAPGLGKEVLPKTALRLKQLIELGEKNVMTFTQFLRDIDVRTNATPYARYTNKRIALIGFGDSAKVTSEWLQRLAPEKAYGLSNAQSGLFKKLFWYGAKQCNCEDFILNNRVRYALGAGGVKSETVDLLTYKVYDVEKMSNGKFRVTDELGVTEIVDIVIAATGFEGLNKKRYQSLLEPSQVTSSLSDFIDLKADLEGLGYKNARVNARQILEQIDKGRRLDGPDESLINLESILQRDLVDGGASLGVDSIRWFEGEPSQLPVSLINNINPNGAVEINYSIFKEFRTQKKKVILYNDGRNIDQLLLDRSPNVQERVEQDSQQRESLRTDDVVEDFRLNYEIAFQNAVTFLDATIISESPRRPLRNVPLGAARTYVDYTRLDGLEFSRDNLNLQDVTVRGRVVAKQVVTPEASRSKQKKRIFILGPGAGQIATREELAGVTENGTSIFALGSRTYDFINVVFIRSIK